jgi:hypothetical protein
VILNEKQRTLLRTRERQRWTSMPICTIETIMIGEVNTGITVISMCVAAAFTFK